MTTKELETENMKLKIDLAMQTAAYSKLYHWADMAVVSCRRAGMMKLTEEFEEFAKFISSKAPMPSPLNLELLVKTTSAARTYKFEFPWSDAPSKVCDGIHVRRVK